jgi:hypothetical protein
VKKPRANYDIQGALIDYLSHIDPWDFYDDYFGSFVEETGVEDYKKAEDVPPDVMKQFVEWIRHSDIPSRWMMDDPMNSPAYLWLADARRMPKGSWLVHFTGGCRDLDNLNCVIRSLTRGSTVHGLHMTTHKTEKETADCSANLTDKIGLYETVWGFAFDARDDWGRLYGKGRLDYGRNALVFQCDYGVHTYHVTDEFHQVIFPLCSEYNAVFVQDVDEDRLVVETVGGEELEFQDHKALIAYMESRQEPSRKIAGLGRLRR